MLASAVAYGTPLLYAALGELLAERSGVLNLGVEGMMLVGAVMGFLAVQRLGGLGRRRAPCRGRRSPRSPVRRCALILAFLVITLRANQIVAGLALTILAGAAGLSSYIGNDFALADDPARHSFRPVDLFGLEDTADRRPDRLRPELARVRLVGLRRSPSASTSSRTRPGLNVRAVGESPAAADAMGIGVDEVPLRCTRSSGGAFAGVGGACFSLALTPQWVDGLTAGAGWIAIALVIFAFWRADLCLVGAYFFGAFSALPLTLQARGVTIDVRSSSRRCRT